MRYPADPPTVEDIVAVMRQARDDRHRFRLRGLIVVLWRGGLRVQDSLSGLERVVEIADGNQALPAIRLARSPPTEYVRA